METLHQWLAIIFFVPLITQLTTSASGKDITSVHVLEVSGVSFFILLGSESREGKEHALKSLKKGGQEPSAGGSSL
jgi:hypothetical protein